MSRRAPSPALADRMAALAAEDAAALTAALAQAPRDPRGVHEARKAVRRLRSLLALAREPLGSPARPLDRRLRALAKGLSALRDAQVVEQTAAMMMREAATAEDTALWQRLQPALAQRHARLLAAALEKDPGFGRRLAQARRQAEELARLPWRRVHAASLRHALEKSAHRQQRAQHLALESGDVDDLHALRRRSRRLRMQLQAMKKLDLRPGPRVRDALPASLHGLSELVDQLGALQDLTILERALRSLEREQRRAAKASFPRLIHRALALPGPVQPLA